MENFKKADILNALRAKKIDNGPKNIKQLDKNELLTKLNATLPKPDGKGMLMANIKNINGDLADPDTTIHFESWKPRTNIKQISQRFLTEAASVMSPNAFRLNLQTIVLDKAHAKFNVTRNQHTATVEILYPNVNGKITVKTSLEGVEDTLVELGLEDEHYVGNFGAYIITLVDNMIKELKESGNDAQTSYYMGAASGGMSGFAPNWEGRASVESDSRRINNLMALVEQEEKPEDDTEAIDAEGADAGTDAEGGADPAEGDVFGEQDFSMDAGGGGGDVGGFDFGGDLGGGMGGDAETAGDVNADQNAPVAGEPEENYMKFTDKVDWLNSALDTMQKLVSSAMANSMQKGKGVILTSDEVLNGTVGIKNDSNGDIVEKFLSIYPALDGIELTESQLNEIEEKLSLDDGQFDSWFQSKLPEFMGQEEVNDVLNNEMFSEFMPMGGEDTSMDEIESQEGEFGDFIDSLGGEPTAGEGEAGMPTESGELPTEESEDAEASIRKEAELDVAQPKQNEFPNV